jgi:hypothetical protein
VIVEVPNKISVLLFWSKIVCKLFFLLLLIFSQDVVFEVEINKDDLPILPQIRSIFLSQFPEQIAG